MKTRIILISTLLFIAMIYSAFSLLPTKIVASTDSACGECMRAAAEDHRNCLQGGKGAEHCRVNFEQFREYCLATACANCNPEVEMCP